MSGKSQTIGDFPVSRLSQILPTNQRKLEIVDIPDRLGWTGTNLENRERLAMDFAHYQSSTLLGSSPLSHINMASLGQTCGDYPIH